MAFKLESVVPWGRNISELWNTIRNTDELEHIRMSAMQTFLNDYEKGLAEKRYIYHELQDRLLVIKKS